MITFGPVDHILAALDKHLVGRSLVLDEAGTGEHRNPFMRVALIHDAVAGGG